MKFYSDFNSLYSSQCNRDSAVFNMVSFGSDKAQIRDNYYPYLTKADDVVVEARPVSPEEWPEFVPNSPLFHYRKNPMHLDIRNLVEYRINDKYAEYVTNAIVDFFERVYEVKKYINFGNGRLLVDYSRTYGNFKQTVERDMEALDRILQPMIEKAHESDPVLDYMP